MPKKVPVVLQMSATDCGAACLAMIVSYWGGRRVSAGTCQAILDGGQSGVTALTLAQGGRALGMTVQAFRHTPAGLASAPLPAILHWRGDHFVVLAAWRGERVTVIDPALGRRVLSPEQVAAGYSGVTLTFAPGPDFGPRMAELPGESRGAGWQAFLGRALGVPGIRPLLGKVLAVSLLLQLAGLLLPLVTWLVVERILPDPEPDSLALLGMALVAGVSAQAGLAYARSLWVVHLQQRLDRRLIPDFFAHMLRLPYGFFQQRTTGDLLSRLEGNGALRELITTGVLTGLLDGGLALVYLVILYAQYPLFGLLVTGTALGHFLLLVLTAQRVQSLSQVELAAQAEEASFAVQVIRGMESVKAAGTETWISQQWQSRFSRSLDASQARGRYLAAVDSLFQLLATATPLLLLWLGVGAVAGDRLDLGQMLALVVLASASLAPLGNLAAYIHRAQQSWAHLARLEDVLSAAPEEASPDNGSRLNLAGRVEVTGLTFAYGGNRGLILDDVSFTIEAGEQVALVGATGAGKSTLVRLLLGLYPPQAGTICYDGRPLASLGLARLRREIGVVLQDSFLVGGTIRENIALHQPQMPLAQVVEAAKLAAIHDEIEQLPMGYESWVGEGGSGLSGGQRQRIALARALATRPALLFLDEATSHLDGVTEDAIYRNLDTLAATRLVIAHRPSTLHNADRVLMLEAGRLVAQPATTMVPIAPPRRL